VALLHGLCPDDTEPMCGGGLWFGFRDTLLVGPADTPIGVAVDLKIGASFGFGWEVGSDIPQDERDSMAFATAMAEGAIGPGLRLGAFELLPAIGIGGEAVAWGTTDRDDDPYAEGYWYSVLAGRVRMDDITLHASGARKFKSRGFAEVFGDSVEAGVTFNVKDKKSKERRRMTLGWWYTQYDTHLVTGLAIGVDARELEEK
jgi:hypothetical protein